MNAQHRITLSDRSAIGAARRLAIQIAVDGGADETHAGRVAIVATELATNLAIHARSGELLIQVIDLVDGRFLELIAIDSGPGMQDVNRCLSDGYSTAGTAGNGLGAIRRLSQWFDVYSLPDRGTVVISRVSIGSGPFRDKQDTTPGLQSLEIGVVSLAVAGETVCGDAFRWLQKPNWFSLIVADGLGHGLLAYEASLEALTAFDEKPADLPSVVLQRAHERMSSTRGGAVACARIDIESRRLIYAGVGNISGSLVDGTRGQGLVSHNGTVGAQMRRVQSFDYPWTPDSLLVMHSDGLSARWNLADYPGLVTRHAAVIAALLYRDSARTRDDATVVVARLAA